MIIYLIRLSDAFFPLDLLQQVMMMTTIIQTLKRLCHVHSSLRVGFGRRLIYVTNGE